MDDPNYIYSVPIIEAAVKNCKLLTPDEALSAANLAYVRAQRRHRVGRTLFARHLKFRIRTALQQEVRDEAKQRHGSKADYKAPVLTAVPLPDVAAPDGDWSTDLSPSAMAVVKLALSHEETEPSAIWVSICRELKDLGWAAARILDTFNEVRELLP